MSDETLRDIRTAFDAREPIRVTAARLGMSKDRVWRTRLAMGLQTKWPRHAGVRK
jgi:hypothetical protein